MPRGCQEYCEPVDRQPWQRHVCRSRDPRRRGAGRHRGRDWRRRIGCDRRLRRRRLPGYRRGERRTVLPLRHWRSGFPVSQQGQPEPLDPDRPRRACQQPQRHGCESIRDGRWRYPTGRTKWRVSPLVAKSSTAALRPCRQRYRGRDPHRVAVRDRGHVHGCRQ